MDNSSWFAGKRSSLVRDLVRDFCLVHRALAAQRGRFEGDTTLSFATLRELLGSEQQKGVFWRLKDNTHLFFRKGIFHADMLGAPPAVATDPDSPDNPAGLLLDWCVGHAFHECRKLMEDAYQRSHYGCYLAQLAEATHDPTLTAPLQAIAGQTVESSRRELARIFHVLDHARTLLTRFLSGEGGNGQLARFLVREQDLVRDVFGASHQDLLRAVYGDPRRVYALAAQHLMGVGKGNEAAALLRQAEPHLDATGLALLDTLTQAGS